MAHEETGFAVWRWKFCFALFVVTLAGSPAYADDVVDWNQTMFRAGLVAGTTPVVMSRVAAIVQAAVFDAVNGIDRRYAPIHVPATGPAGASRDAAAAQAAYATLVQLYPAQKSLFDARLAVSLAEIATHASSAAVASGVTWGQTVANGILAWRGADGFTPAPPPFLGATTVGVWRPTPPAFAPGAVPQFATMVPWVIAAPSQFRPAGPPLLASARYANDFNETKNMGSVSSATRTPDQTVFSWFWNSGTAIYIWNNLAVSLINRTDDDELWNSRDEGGDFHDDSRSWRRSTHNTTLENARLFALLNLAMADAAIGCWEAKYNYVFWRPVTAIPEAAADDNPATTADPTWAPLFATPAFPEYPSGHSCVSAAAGAVLADAFGEHTRFTVESDAMPGVARSFRSFSSALEEVKNARVFAGIHFRSATDDGQELGASVGRYVLEHAVQPVGP
jgi:hypothetical protein